MTKMDIFVFGSNEAGRHGAGAARVAYLQYGAVYGWGYGHYGNSFAIPTLSKNLKPIPLERIRWYVHGLLAYAEGRPEWNFQVTRIGCGLAGRKDRDMASMFHEATDNLFFDEAWAPWLPTKPKWGVF